MTNTTACLEGEIAKRDARIVELESRYQRDVYGLNNEGDPIGGDPAGGYANDNARLRAELAMAQEIEDLRRRIAPVQQVSVPDWWRELLRDIEQFFEGAGVSPGPDIELRMAAMLAAAPAAPAADAGLVEALDYQVLFDAIAAATSVYANGAVNISVQAFRESLAARRDQGWCDE